MPTEVGASSLADGPARPPSLVNLAGPGGPPVPSIGEPGPSFDGLVGVDGGRYALGSFADRRILVLAFLGNSCPAAKGLLPELVALQERFGPQGVQVVGINPNNPHLSPRDSLAEMIRFAEEHALDFPYLKDANGAVARGYGARNTPHFVVLDADRRLRYRGRMFDSREPARATRRDLEEVLGALLEGRPFDPAENAPLGCGIVW